MDETTIDYRLGVPEHNRFEAAELYEAAFGPKFSVAISSKQSRLQLLADTFHLEFAFAAIWNGELVGLAGFHSQNGALTGGLKYTSLLDHVGFIRGNWAAMIFSFYERKLSPNEMLMDGISVRPDMRGKGIGKQLLYLLAEYAKNEGYSQIRLDVIDTNPNARRLYERCEFIPTKTEHFGDLRWLLGFGASTTLIRCLDAKIAKLES